MILHKGLFLNNKCNVIPVITAPIKSKTRLSLWRNCSFASPYLIQPGIISNNHTCNTINLCSTTVQMRGTGDTSI